MTNAQKVAHRLLEATLDLKDLIPGEEWYISQFPPELHRHLTWGNNFGPSRDFLEALSSPEKPEVSWQFNDPLDLPAWPFNEGAGDTEDPDDSWTFRTYYCTLVIRDGQLYVQRRESDRFGDTYLNEEALWGSEEHQRMRQELGRRAHIEACIKYFRWVNQVGDDPLEWFGTKDAEKVAAKLERYRAKLRDPQSLARMADPNLPTYIIP